MPTLVLDKPTKGKTSFDEWYAIRADKFGLSPNPDDPRHFYDYRAAYEAGAEPDKAGHWPSKFKTEGHPNLIVDGINTKTGLRVPRLVLDEPTALQNDPNDITIRAEESLDVADNLELPLIQAEEIADVRDGEKLERPGLFKRGVFGLVNKALVQPVKNIFKYGGIGKLDIDLEVFGELRRIKEETGKEVSDEEFMKIYERMKAKVEGRIQAAVPALQLPPAKGIAERGVELATGLGAFVARLVLARKFVGGKGVGAEIAAFEVVNQVDNGPPGLGVLLAGSLGLIGKVPAASLGGKGLKLAGQGGALATVTATRGGEPEDIAVAFFLPVVLQTFNQFPNLIKGKAWDIKTAKGAEELGIFKGIPIKNIKQWSAAMRDAAKVKMGTMTPKRWGAKHGKNLEDFSNKVGKTYDNVVKITGERAKPAVTKPPAKAVVKAPSKPVKAKPKPKAKIIPIKPEVVEVAPEAKEIRDVLGGVDPLNQIHIALKAAKAVRPITEAAKKEALRKRVGAAAGALRAGLKAGMPAEQAILKSTGLLKGPLTEYDQIYESIEDTIEPRAKDAAYNMIATHPDLKYFEVVGTQKSFQKLLAGSSLTPTEAAQIERVFGKAFEEQLAKVTTKSDLYDQLITYWKATLLTGLKTSGLNILSTAGHAMSETTKDVPAALIDSGISLVTGERKVAFTVKGYPTGWVEGLGKGWRYMKTGYDERNVGEKYDYKRTNFGTSKIARTIQATTDFVFHLLGAEDQPWYYGAYSRSLHSQAIAQAKTKGLKGKEKKDFINNLQKNPTDEMLIWAKEDADTAIYTNRTNLGDLGKAIQKIKGGEVIVPFARTPSAVAMQIINYSPIGIVKEIAHEAHEGKFNQRKFSHAAGRTVVGTAALYLGVQLFKAGLIALGYPKSERERKLWELEGKKPNSVLIDGKWRGIEALGPTGNLLIIGGYFQQALDSKGSPTEAMIEAMAGGAKSFTEQTFVRGVNLAVDALTDPEASFERWFTSMSGSLVPTIVADIARAQDDRARRAVGPKERIQSRIPIYRRGLPPKIDVFGQDLPRYGGNVLETMADPTRPSKIRQDVVVDELRRLWDKDIKVSPTLLGDKAGYDILTKEENTQLWRRAGELTYKGLLAEVNTEGYKEANDFAKGKLLDFVIRNAKAVAKLEIVIIKKAQGKTIMQLAESGLFSVEEFEMLKYFQESEKEK